MKERVLNTLPVFLLISALSLSASSCSLWNNIPEMASKQSLPDDCAALTARHGCSRVWRNQPGCPSNGFRPKISWMKVKNLTPCAVGFFPIF